VPADAAGVVRVGEGDRRPISNAGIARELQGHPQGLQAGLAGEPLNGIGPQRERDRRVVDPQLESLAQSGGNAVDGAGIRLLDRRDLRQIEDVPDPHGLSCDVHDREMVHREVPERMGRRLSPDGREQRDRHEERDRDALDRSHRAAA